MKKLYKNVTLVLPRSLMENAWILLDNDIIRDFGQERFPEAEEILDGNGRYICPGFVDLHVHGGGGADFRDSTRESYLRALNVHLHGGTTTILPTLSSARKDTLLKSIAVFNELKKEENTLEGIPHLAGMHLEGPYFSLEQAGAQNPEIIRNPDPAEYLQILEAAPYLRRWSIACELPGALELGRELFKRGISASIGHSNATTEQAITAYESGYDCVTHLYSSCSTLHRNGPYREGGVVEAAFLLEDLDVELIADGIHLPPLFLKMILRVKGEEHISLITDCIRPGGTEYIEGETAYDDLEKKHPIYLENHVAVMPDRKSFAGSISTTSNLVRTMVFKCGVDLPTAVRMASLNPAGKIGLSNRIGSIEVGKQADLLLLDPSLKVEKVLLCGQEI